MAIRMFLRTLFKDKRGATAVEYGLIVSLIVIVLIASMKQLGGGSGGMWGNLGDIANTYL
ncbi:Flp family type IVb pilin [Sphingomicrobium sp. GRR-S6-50]|uniref:Flp family type IVb pilin n=1 Tax=Sphingomicrobium sediminis TaxID=2950949 RepID=A0A9X2J3M9_9SPHN|nr:Flp family type IVb pilin [Sphingomicrobium sediminis]